MLAVLSRFAAGTTASYSSVGKLGHLPRRALDVAQPGAARQIVATRSYRSEIIIFTAEASMAGWGFHWVKQLRGRGYEHWLILSDGAENCRGMHKKWERVQAATSNEPLSCVYSSYPRTHPGWKQWAGHGGREDKMHNVYVLWATRWWVALALLREGANVLSLDVDAVLLSDIYQLLRAPPLAHYDVIITRNDDGSQSLNCGFVYFNLDAAHAAQQSQRLEVQGHCESNTAEGPAASGRRLWAPPGDTAGSGSGAASNGGVVHGGAMSAAEWVAELMWERLRLFLEIDKRGLRRPPAREVLWEQDAWNDLAKSLELRRRVFPWVTGYGKDSDLWASLGYQRRVVDSFRHREKWVQWRKLRLSSLPLSPPEEPPWAGRFFSSHVATPLLWLPLCAPANTSTRASVTPPAGMVEGLPLGLETARPFSHGRLLIAPVWLASLGPDPESDWAGASPSPLSYVHITNMWKCFPHPCWSKAGRLFWLRAHGFWDKQLDTLGLTPRGAPFTSTTRVLSLPAAAYSTFKALARTTRKMPTYPRSHALHMGFRRLHAVVHNLVTIAGLLGRKPVVPQVPCELVRAIQSRDIANTKKSRFGLCHAAVIATGPSTSPICHLAPGTWRPGGPDQCYHNAVMYGFDFDDFVQQPYVRGRNGSVAVAGAPRLVSGFDESLAVYSRGALDLDPIRHLCREATALKDVHVLQLDGLLPLQDMLVDRPLTLKEFKFEKQRLKSRQPRWPSLLQSHELQQLRDVCPGASRLIEFRDRKSVV